MGRPSVDVECAVGRPAHNGKNRAHRARLQGWLGWTASRGRRRRKTCVSAKRTHRFGGRIIVEHPYHKILMPFAVGFCRWVRFGKRTHRRGVLRSVSSKNGFVFRKTKRLGGVATVMSLPRSSPERNSGRAGAPEVGIDNQRRRVSIVGAGNGTTNKAGLS